MSRKVNPAPSSEFDDFRAAEEKWLLENIPKKRWFGQKTKRVEKVVLDDLCVDNCNEYSYVYCFNHVVMDDGSTQLFFTPLVGLLGNLSGAGGFDAELQPGRRLKFYDIADVPDLSIRMLEHFRLKSVLRTLKGEISFHSEGLGTEGEHTQLYARASGVEQSNVSLFFDRKYYLKQYRHVAYGSNPDFDVPYHLVYSVGYTETPKPLGFAVYTSQTGNAVLLGLFEFVDNLGDGWNHFTQGLKDSKYYSDLLADCEVIGSLTARLHLSLSKSTGDPRFDPEQASHRDLEEWVKRYEQTLRGAVAAAERALRTTSFVERPVLERFLASAASLEREPTTGVGKKLLDLFKIRIHGDYHLGQILKTQRGYVVIDFEGEPLQEMDERVKKWFALKDVAGMLRSLSYAAGYVAISDVGNPQVKVWVAQARQKFLDSYWSMVKGINIVPHQKEDFLSLLRVFETEKALYELRYELENRPTWVSIPLAALIREGV
ncbi:MAG: phosphotransferase [Thermoprotei archaeon]